MRLRASQKVIEIIPGLQVKNTLFSMMLSFLVGFGEFEESGPGDGVAVGVDHQVPTAHHRQILAWEHRRYQPGHFTSQRQRKA